MAQKSLQKRQPLCMGLFDIKKRLKDNNLNVMTYSFILLLRMLNNFAVLKDQHKQ